MCSNFAVCLTYHPTKGLFKMIKSTNIQFEKLLTKLLRDIVVEFIAHPEDLEINSKRFNRIISITWRGHKADTARMIGEGGHTYHHLREIMRLAGEAHGYDADLARVDDPIKGKPERYNGFTPKKDWPRRRLLSVLEAAALACCRHDQVEIEECEIRANTSAVVVKLDERESLNTETVLKNSLKHVAGTIFPANGRLVKLQLERSLPAGDQQPESYAGRFTR